ncbi:MAG: HEAT repeat domain-containing protein [Planctomycetia bacterium]
MSDGVPAEVAALIEQLASTDAEQRSEAAERLARAGEGAAAAAVPLVRACGDADERVREWAVAALEDLGPPSGDAVASLVKLVAAPDPLVAYWATTLLGRSGQDAANAVAALAGCLDSQAELSVRQRAAWALGQIGPAARAACEPLRRAAGQGDERLARLATEALAAIGS